MKKATKEKLDLLQSTGMMTNETYDYIKEVDHYLLQEINEDVDDETLLIHIAMAINRCERKEKIDAMPEEILASIKLWPEYREAKKYFNYVKQGLPMKLPTYENGYIMLHLVNILRREK